MRSTTPTTTPPKEINPPNGQPANAPAAQAAPAPDTSAILKALADMAKTSNAASAMPHPSSSNVTNPQNAFLQNVPPVNQALSVPPNVPAVSFPGSGNGVPSFAGLSSGQPDAQSMANGLSAMQSQPSMSQVNMTPESFQQQLQIIQTLQAKGIPQDQWAAVLSVLMSSGGGMAAAPNANSQVSGSWPQGGGYRDDPRSRDSNSGYGDHHTRSPPSRFRPRSRSRSPSRYDRRRDNSPPRRRDSPDYGEYRGDRNGGRDMAGRGRGRGHEYHLRSPDRNRNRTPSPPRRGEPGIPPPGPKWLEYDRSLGPDTIKGIEILPLVMQDTALLTGF